MYPHFILIVALWGTPISDVGTNKYAEFNDEVSCIYARGKIINDLTIIECFQKGKDDDSK